MRYRVILWNNIECAFFTLNWNSRAKEKLDDPLPEDEQDGTEKITVFQNNTETTGKRHFNKLEREQHAATRPPFNSRDHEEKSEFQDRRFCSIFRSLNIKGKYLRLIYDSI